MAYKHLLILFILYISFLYTSSFPRPPAYCNENGCFVTNSYGSWNTRQVCRVAKISYPSTEEELLEAVGFGSKRNMRMKAVSKLSHSIPPLACPEGDTGLLISTSNYTHNIEVDASGKTVTADSGVQLEDLIEEVAKHGLALSASPYWNGLSVGGILSTGSHGSSWHGKGSSIHDHVLQITMVIPIKSCVEQTCTYAKLVSLTEADGDKFFSALVSLGTLGVISKVTLSVEPMFKRSITNLKSSDASLEEKIVRFGNEHEFGDVIWYPSKREAVYRLDDRVPTNTSGDGANNYIGFQPTLSGVIIAQRALEEQAEEKRSAKAKCLTSQAQVSLIQTVGYGLKNRYIFTGYPVVGYQHKLQAAGGCQHAASGLLICGWDSSNNALFYHETGVTVPTQSIKLFIEDVKALRDTHPDAGSMCGIDLYTGVLLRFVKRSQAFLGKQFDGVDVGFTYYRARNGSEPRLYEDVWEEIEQMLVFKYGGLPHWGKNKKYLFGTKLTEVYPNLVRFIAVKKALDPEALFSSAWSDQVLGLTGFKESTGRGCALEGLCVCSKDEHCAPEKGYYCRQGRVYQGAKVCRYVDLIK